MILYPLLDVYLQEWMIMVDKSESILPENTKKEHTKGFIYHMHHTRTHQSDGCMSLYTPHWLQLLVSISATLMLSLFGSLVFGVYVDSWRVSEETNCYNSDDNEPPHVVQDEFDDSENSMEKEN